MICTVDVEGLSGCLSAYQGGNQAPQGKTKLQVVYLQHQHMVCPTKDPTYRSGEGERVCLKGRAKPPKKLGARTEVWTREMLCRDNQLLTPNPGGSRYRSELPCNATMYQRYLIGRPAWPPPNDIASHTKIISRFRFHSDLPDHALC